jgi:hypothetical protein
MKITEFKLRVVTGLNRLIDDYFGDNNIKDNFINATLKLLVKQNQNKYDYILNMFADENGCIDAHNVVSTYANMIGDEGITFDIRNYIDNDYLRAILPNKVLIINKNDITSLLT